MVKTTAWLMTLIGVLWLLPMIGLDIGASLSGWLIGLSFLIIGITKLIRNYNYKGRK